MASTHIESPTLANPATGASKKGTWSFWMKRGNLGGSRILNTNENSNNEFLVSFKTDDTMQIYQIAGGSNLYQYRTNRKFRDINSWYHIVLAIDTTLGTAGDRVKLYVNGVQETSFQTTTNNMPQNHSFHGLYGGIKQNIGRDVAHGSEFFDGVLSYFAFIDGTQELPTIFGETDSTTGEWKIKTTITPSSAWGTNGYLILKDGNSLTDQSTNSNNFSSVAGTLTKTEDCPSNVFCTWNRLNKGSYIDMNYGNTNIYGNTNNNNGNTWGTISFPPSGKYYWETKVIAYNSGSTGYPQIGIIRDNTIAQGDMNTGSGGYVSSSSDCYYPAGGTTVYSKNGNITVSATSLNDVIMCAMDSTAGNMKFWMGVNGTWWNSGDPANGTNAIWTETGDYQSVPFIAGFNASRGDSNFGNGYFGTTAVSSAGTNASNNGIFEYDVPTGFTALSTRGMNL
jgi:hypothetical protein|tara:strand:- start:1239 stop:2594 length:1356 start_codon:yes stop_codon:yes gene_type:complete